MRLTVNNTNANTSDTITVTGIELSTSTTGVNLCGTGSATVNGTATAFTVSSNGSQSITLGLGTDGVEIAAGSNKVFYFVVAPFATSSSLTFTVHADGMSDFTKTVNNKTLPRNTLAGASININGVPVPLFQVDASGTKVKFAPGNLRYTSSATYPWSFCEHQYDYNTNNNGDNGVWDYFGWSTDNATAPYGMNPSVANAYYSGNFADWGTAVNNQGNLDTGWRTLSQAEWDYIFNTRLSGVTIGTTTNCRYLKATVCTTKGVILIPDGCTWPSGVTYAAATNFNAADLDYSTNTYDATAWASLEAAGCVFLPAAGYRNGSFVSLGSYYGYYGSYWSSTPSGTSSAYYLYFNESSVKPQNNSNRSAGRSVRLVQNQN